MFKRAVRIFLFLALWGGGLARAQSGADGFTAQVTYAFAQEMIFRVRLPAHVSPDGEVFAFVQAEGEPQARVLHLQPQPDGSYLGRLDLNQAALPPFALVRYWFGAEQEGKNLLSQRYTLRYVDNRYPWQTLAEDGVNVHWYAGDLAFGQAVLETALATRERMRPLAPFPAEARLDVYVYASYEDLAGTLGEGAAAWVGSHAYPGLSVALAVVPPGVEQRARMEQHISHEVMHILLDFSTEGRTANLPLWLREGLASLAEPVPDAGYEQALRAARAENALLPLDTLCLAFPPDSGRAYLAYAESASFVRYLRARFGDQALRHLVQVYADGRDCASGVQAVYGVSLDALNHQWRSDALEENPWQLALPALAPYLVLVAIVLLVPLWQFALLQEKEKHE